MEGIGTIYWMIHVSNRIQVREPVVVYYRIIQPSIIIVNLRYPCWGCAIEQACRNGGDGWRRGHVVVYGLWGTKPGNITLICKFRKTIQVGYIVDVDNRKGAWSPCV